MNLSSNYLAERGLSAENLLGVEIDSAPCKDRIKERLGERCVPLWDLGTQEIIWFQTRNGSERSWIARPLPTLPKGNPKFVTPVNGEAPPFIPATPAAAMRGTPIILTEGPVKALVCAQAGVASVGLNGVWCAAPAKGEGQKLTLRKELVTLGLRGRQVYIAFDSDAQTKPEVRQAEIRLYLLLTAAGAEVFRLSWPVHEGKGVDDHLVFASDQRGLKPTEALASLMNQRVFFIETITKGPVDLHAIEAELSKVSLSILQRDQLANDLAKRLGVRAESLRQLGTEQEVKIIGLSFDSDPDPWTEPVSGSEVFHELSSLIRRHVFVTNDSLVTITLWTVITYLSDIVETLPILAVRSPDKRCGKTRLLAVLSRLVHRPLTSSNVSSAAIYRVIQKYAPTLIIDEGDTFLRNKDNDELRGILNSGHTRDTAYVLRDNRESGEVERFSTWSPKVLALIGRLPDTLSDRSLVVDMDRKKREEQISALRETPAKDWEMLRRKLVRWTGDHKDRLAASSAKIPPKLNDRAGDNWFPLLVIANEAGDDWPDLTKSAIGALADDDDSGSIENLILLQTKSAFKELNQDRDDGFLSTDQLIKHLNANPEMPWSDWRNGKGLSAEKFSRVLKAFSVKSIQRQIENERARGYGYEKLNEIFTRYL